MLDTAAPVNVNFNMVNIPTVLNILWLSTRYTAYITELARQNRLPINGSVARSVLFCVEIQSMAPANPINIPIIFIPVTFSLKKSTVIINTHIGCIEEKMELDIGVVLLNPIR